MRVYLDNAATTALDPKVLDHMMPLLTTHFGNPSSIHQHGRIAKNYVEESRKTIAQGIRASIGEIFFTSSATEANNLAIQSAVRDLGVKSIISTQTEHDCVLNSIQFIESCHPVKVTMLDLNEQGEIDLQQLEESLKGTESPCLVSIMHANNEIGTIADVEAISQLCETYDAYYHCDTVQTVGKYPIDVSETKFSFISGSGHKFFGPKGVGFIYINNDNLVKPILYGGSQERNMRAGTENTYGIAGIGEAFRISVDQMEQRSELVDDLRQHFIKGLLGLDTDVRLISPENGHRHIVSVGFPKDAKTDLLKFNLDISGISASSGSACSSGVASASHVLKAIGLAESYNAVRFSFSHHNTKEELDFTIEKLKSMI